MSRRSKFVVCLLIAVGCILIGGEVGTQLPVVDNGPPKTFTENLRGVLDAYLGWIMGAMVGAITVVLFLILTARRGRRRV